MHKHLFDPLIEIFRENKDRYNMINSSIIELFDFIDKEYNQFPPPPPSSSSSSSTSSSSSSKNHTPSSAAPPSSPVNSSNFKFISYLVSRYRDDFAAITYVPTFSNILSKFDSHSHLIPLSFVSLSFPFSFSSFLFPFLFPFPPLPFPSSFPFPFPLIKFSPSQSFSFLLVLLLPPLSLPPSMVMVYQNPRLSKWS